MGDRLLHDARALHDLRQEHLARAEEVADDPHAVHERALDHVERSIEAVPRLLDVLVDEVGHAVHECVRQALGDRLLPPGEVDLARRARATYRLGEGHQPLGRFLATVEDHVLDAFEQVSGDLLVDRELARVHDAHVHAGLHGVVEEGRVHRLADDVVAAEREREVRDTAADQGPRAGLLDRAGRLDERQRVLVVLLDPGRDCEDVRVEDDVLGRKADILGQDAVGAPADRDAVIGPGRLSLLVEGHDDDGGAEFPHASRVRPEGVLALLQADRVDDALALHALQSGLDHLELRRVDHGGHARDLRLGRDELQEVGHFLR